MKYLYQILAVLALLFVRGEAAKPNLLFIIADDCTFRDLAAYGGQAHTPNIDSLVKQGLKFERCFQAAPMCSPTRHCIYIGLYPVKSGAYPNHTFARDDVKSIVHHLKPLGYRVALSGKSHVGPAKVFPFEESRSSKKNSTDLPSAIDFKAVDALMRDSADKGTPFALFACSNEPHSPWTQGKQFRPRYELSKIKLPPYLVDTPQTRKAFRNYLCEISFFDLEVGRLLESLDRHGLADNTLVMLVSEQGNGFPFAKWSCYDAGLQSAMVVRWPGVVKPGARTDAMVEYVDICPTFIDAAGGTPPDFLDGKSFLNVLRGGADTHKSHVFGLQTTRGIYSGAHHYPIRSVRDDRFKLILNLDPDATFYNSINQEPWFKSWEKASASGDAHARRMLVRFAKRPAVELYDVRADPHEMQNLAALPEHKETIDRLRTKLEAWMKSQGDRGMATEL